MTPEFAHYFGIRSWEIENMTDREVREHIDWIADRKKRERERGVR